MRPLLLTVSFCFILLKTIKAQTEITLYSRRYERINVDEILRSPRLVTNYVDCLLNKKPCPPEGKSLKRILPEALRTKCGRCWPAQKEGALKVITKLYYDYPQHYDALRQKWDTSGEYHRRFEEYLRDRRFNSISNSPPDQITNEQGVYPQVSNRIEIVTQDIPVTVAQTQLHAIAQKPNNPNIPERTQYVSPSPQDPKFKSTVLTLITTIPPIISSSTVEQLQQSSLLEMNVDLRPTRQDVLTTTKTTTRATIKTTTTKVPRAPQNDPSFDLNNRIGYDDEQPLTTRRSPSLRTASPQNHQPNRLLPGFVSTTKYRTNNPILNIINRLAMKFTTTAEFIAGALHHPPQGRRRNNNYEQYALCQQLIKLFRRYYSGRSSRKPNKSG